MPLSIALVDFYLTEQLSLDTLIHVAKIVKKILTDTKYSQKIKKRLLNRAIPLCFM